MIVGSLLLTLCALALLLVGLVDGSDPALVGSIAASLLAAIAIIIGSWRAGSGRVPPGATPVAAGAVGGDDPGVVAAGDGMEEPVTVGDGVTDPVAAGDGARVAAGQAGAVRPGREPMTAVIPAARVATDRTAVRDGAGERPVSPPAAETVIPAQGGAARRTGDELRDDGPVALDDSGDEEPPDEPVAQRVAAGDAARVARMSNEVLVIDGRPRYHLARCPHLLGRSSEALPVHEAVELGFTPCGLCEPDTVLLAEAGRA